MLAPTSAHDTCQPDEAAAAPGSGGPAASEGLRIEFEPAAAVATGDAHSSACAHDAHESACAGEEAVNAQSTPARADSPHAEQQPDDSARVSHETREGGELEGGAEATLQELRSTKAELEEYLEVEPDNAVFAHMLAEARPSPKPLSCLALCSAHS